jgi:hypothetical protein
MDGPIVKRVLVMCCRILSRFPIYNSQFLNPSDFLKSGQKVFFQVCKPQCVLFLAFLDQHRNLRKVLHFPFSVEAKIIYEPKTHFWLPPMSAEDSHSKPKLKIQSENYLREVGMDKRSAMCKLQMVKGVYRKPVHAHLNLDVRGACVRPKKWSQLTLCISNGM